MEIKQNGINSDKIKSSLKNILLIAIRIIVSAAILYYLFSLVQWNNVIDAYQTANGFYIFIAAILLIVNIGCRTIKWQIMLRSVKSKPTIWEAFGSVMLGISLGSFTPGEIGEYAGRALHIIDVKRSHLIGLTLLDKAQIFIITCGAGTISLILITIENIVLASFLSLIIITLSVFILLRMNLFSVFGQRLNTTIFKKAWLSRVFDGFNLLLRPQILATTLWTLAFHFILVLQMFFLVNSFSNIIFINTFIGTSAMLFVKSFLPISLGDLGIREAGSIYFFSLYNIPQAAALNASLLLFIINVFIPSAIGTFFIRHQQLSTEKIFHHLKKIKE